MILFLFSIFNMKKLFSIVSPPTFHLAPRPLCLNPEYFLRSQRVQVLAPTYSLPLSRRIPVQTASNRDTEPIRYVTLHFRDRPAQLAPLQQSHRNHRSCVNRSLIPYGFRAGASYRLSVNITWKAEVSILSYSDYRPINQSTFWGARIIYVFI